MDKVKSNAKRSSLEKINSQHKFNFDIVLVDDDEDDQMLFAHLISDINHRLQVFSSGFAVLDFLTHLHRKDYPSLLVLDYHIPGCNGLDVLAQLKANASLHHIPVIVYSSEMNDQLESKLRTFGAIRCFKKATDLREMKECLRLFRTIFQAQFNLWKTVNSE